MVLSFFRRVRNIAKATISFVMSVCLSIRQPHVRPRGMTWLSLDGFSWNFMFFSQICRNSVKFYENVTSITTSLHED